MKGENMSQADEDSWILLFRKSEAEKNDQCFQVIKIDLSQKAGDSSGVEQNVWI